MVSVCACRRIDDIKMPPCQHCQLKYRFETSRPLCRLCPQGPEKKMKEAQEDMERKIREEEEEKAKSTSKETEGDEEAEGEEDDDEAEEEGEETDEDAGTEEEDLKNQKTEL